MRLLMFTLLFVLGSSTATTKERGMVHLVRLKRNLSRSRIPLAALRFGDLDGAS